MFGSWGSMRIICQFLGGHMLLCVAVGVHRVWIMAGVSNPGLLKFNVFCRCGSPGNCDSDGRLDCFRSPVVVAVDVCCMGSASTVSVAVLPIVVELPGLIAEPKVTFFSRQDAICCIGGHCISFSLARICLPLSSRGPSMYVRSLYHVGPFLFDPRDFQR